MHRPRQSAFTLVELLVVIAIIGILVALLLPAVNAAREAGRRAACLNNIKQLATASLTHENAHQTLPTGGWGWGWVGDADQGYDMHQPGGWIYNILPYVEQGDLHDMGKGITSTVTKSTSHGNRMQIPTAVTLCPTRRKVQVYPYARNAGGNFTVPATAKVAKADYAMNAGDKYGHPSDMGLWSSSNGGNCGINTDCGPPSIPNSATLNKNLQAAIAFKSTGVAAPMVALSMASIRDGTSYVYLLGEKYLNADKYQSGDSNGDNENQYMGFNEDIVRWTDPAIAPLQRDHSISSLNPDAPKSFGSPHAPGVNMAFCDGSVRLMAYDIDPTVHKQLGNRADGQPTQLQKIGLPQ